MRKQELSYKVEGRGLGKVSIFLKFISLMLFFIFFYIFTALFFLVNTSLKTNNPSLVTPQNLAYVWIFMIVFNYLTSRKFFYGVRTYYMNDSGLEINNGESNKKYLWDEFSHFYVYVKTKYSKDKKYAIFYKNSGKIFCLRLKEKGFLGFLGQSVVVYSLSENAEEVEAFLAGKLLQKKMASGEEAFVSDYKFK